jgi:hypothetical protein
MDLACPVLPDPERPFRPREAGRIIAARHRDRGEYATGLGIDLLNPISGDLKHVMPVEGGAGSCANRDRAYRSPARRIERVQRVSRGKPDVLPVKGDPVHLVDVGKGTVFTDDLGR